VRCILEFCDWEILELKFPIHRSEIIKLLKLKTEI